MSRQRPPTFVPAATRREAARSGAAVLPFRDGRPPADDFVQDPGRWWRMDVDEQAPALEVAQ